MKVIFACFTAVSLFVGALSLTCYRCGGASEACSTGGSNTVVCDGGGLTYGCQVYTVNYTSLSSVLDFKSCCLVEDCNKNPCDEFGADVICSKMASCQKDKCNFDYNTTQAGPRPTPSAKAPTLNNHSGYLVWFALLSTIALAYMK